MDGKRFLVGVTLLLALNGSCLAVTKPIQGSIQFYGSIVELSCGHHEGGSPMIELNDCSTRIEEDSISVYPVELTPSPSPSAHSHSIATLLASKLKSGRYFDQQYTLINDVGNPLSTGMYIVMVTYP